MLSWIAAVMKGEAGSAFAQREEYVPVNAAVAVPDPDEEEQRVHEARERMEKRRQQAVSFLGDRYVLYPRAGRAESGSPMMKRPPSVLDEWRRLHPNPNLRVAMRGWGRGQEEAAGVT
jgi:hypothetical protein